MKKRKVFQYDEEGNFIKEFSGVIEAATLMGNKDDATLISRACRKGYIHKGFHYSYDQTFENKVETKAPQLPKVLILDIETAPAEGLIWGTNKQYIPHTAIIHDWFILGFAAKWLFDEEMISHFVTSKEAVEKNDKRVCQKAWELIDKCDIVIAHNGDEFDIKRLNTRWRFHHFVPPRPFQSIDTYKSTKNKFAHSSYKLDFLAMLFHNEKKLRTDFQLWKNCINGDSEELKYMEKYCCKDLLILEEYYLSIRAWIRSHPNLGLHIDKDKMRCNFCLNDEFQQAGQYTTPASKFTVLRCLNCGGLGRLRKSDLSKKDRENTLISIAR